MKSIWGLIILLMFSVSFQSTVFGKAKKRFPKKITLTADNTLIFNASFRSRHITRLTEEATKLDANLPSGYPLYLFLRTPGGYIQSGIDMLDFLNGLNRPVHTITNFSASMGFQAVQHLDNRYIVKYGILMSHKAKGGFYGEFSDGASQLDARYGMWLRRILAMDKQTVKRTNGKQTLKSYRAAYENELWLHGREAVDQGYADAVVSVHCDASLSGVFEIIYKFWCCTFGVVYSKCPLKTAPIKYIIYIETNQGTMVLDDFLKKGGKFGKNCRDHATVASEYYSTKIEASDAELCASNKELNLKVIYEQQTKLKKELNKDLKTNIERSY